MDKKIIKAVGLLSGGLDSILAVKCMLEQGISVIPVHFLMPFMRSSPESVENSSMKRHCDQFGLTLRVITLADDYLAMVMHPMHGHGRNLNPCIDCKILFLHEAGKVMKQEGADFIFTGEVIGQRPMSQHLWALEEIEKKAGLEGLLLRPLSAQRLPPTQAEQQGWIDRKKMFAISGRSRKEQLRLASQWGIEDFPNPAGGCLLTERHFCARLADLISHRAATLRNCELLKFGRYFRLSDDFFLIVGRSRSDNDAIRKLVAEEDCLMDPETVPGPTAIGVGDPDDASMHAAMGITARYTDPDADFVTLRLVREGKVSIHRTDTMEDLRVKALMI